METRLSLDEQYTLLRLARQAMEQAVRGEKQAALDAARFTARLRAPGASFATLTKSGELRGCIGALEPYQPLVQDVREHAAAAALEDPRFPPVQIAELDQIEIELSCLTVPEKFEYKSAEELLAGLHPHVHGVLLRDGFRRATYLPQVWAKIPDKAAFMDSLCEKMGVPADLWRHKHLEIFLYQVEEFHE
jgi:AmmeMemoRadiSam system protein A